jgi:predicted phage gp36 major capsid-like protein
VIEAMASHAQDAADQTTQAFESFRQACRNPPNPPGRRTQTQLKSYKAELVDRLLDDCGKLVTKARGLLTGWKTELPSERLPELDKVLRALQ